MAKVDNFDLISENFLFSEDLIPAYANDWFYMVQIMTRTKDTGEKPKHIRTMFVESREYLLSHKDMIAKLCAMFNARAYIAVNPSSYKKCAVKMIKELAEVIDNENYKGILSLPETCAGKYAAEGADKKWVVDLDGMRTDEEIQPFIDFIIKEYNDGKGKPNWSIVTVPTVSGSHLLVSPFDVRGFKKEWPTIDIHKDSPTLLYYEG